MNVTTITQHHNLTPEAIDGMSADELDALTIDDLRRLHEAGQAEAKRWQARVERIEAAVIRKAADREYRARQKTGRKLGQVTLGPWDNTRVTILRRAYDKFDQGGLAELAQQMQATGLDPSCLLAIERKVRKAALTNTAIPAAFIDAAKRCTSQSPGKVALTLEAIEPEVVTMAARAAA